MFEQEAPVGQRAGTAFRRIFFIAALVAAHAHAHAQEAQLDTEQQKQAPTAFAARDPVPVLNWGEGNGRSFAIPAGEIVGYEYLLNRVDHYLVDGATYPSPINNFHDNLHRKWVVDNDAFATNQFLHPYQGSVYQGFARSAGLSFWESFGYTMAGSLLWETSGENTAPSINDQVATGIGGLFLGESLFRMASLLLESSPGSGPTTWREWAAAAISPPTGLNRAVFGQRFRGVFRSNDPAVFTRLEVGATLNSHFSSNININADPTAPPSQQTLKDKTANADFTMSYGLPGKPDYTYDRPFDYFQFEFVASTADTFETASSRGLLVGAPYALGDSYRGIWGLYGTYTYISPQIFRVSSTGLAFGTTAQWWLSKSVALQGSALAGAGYAGGGVIHGSGVTQASPLGDGQRDYHYGIAPQELAAMRLIFGDRVSLDSQIQDYYISRVAATESTGSENIARGDLALTVRVYNLHGITLRYSESRRVGTYANLPTSRQTVGTFSIGYTLLGQTRFGAVDWRPSARDDESDDP